MFRFFLAIFRLIFFSLVLGLSLISIIAALGFIHPAFDIFNHFQPFLFTGTLFLILLIPIFLQNKKWQSFTITIAATGFISSAIIVVPELVLNISAKLEKKEAESFTYKLLTQNIFGRNYSLELSAKAIKEENPDIVVLQEYFPGQRHKLHALLKEDYPYYEICTGGKRANIAIYSKLEFQKLSSSICAFNNEQRVSRLLVRIKGKGGDNFTIVTTHLDWPIQISQFKKSENFFTKINLMFARKQKQFADLAMALRTFNGPLILAGDFNSTSWSYSLRNFAKENELKLLTRAVLTYPNQFYIFGWRNVFPIIGLDHIMTKGDVTIYELRKGKSAGSDHNSIIIRFSV